MDKYCYDKETGIKLRYFNIVKDETPEWYTKYFLRDVEEHKRKVKEGRLRTHEVQGNYYVFKDGFVRIVKIMDDRTFERDFSLEPIKQEANGN